jgi:hypothetical protein
MSANADSTAASPSGTIALKPSSNGSAATPSAAEPVIPGLSTSTTAPQATSVSKPVMPAFGMSLAGLCDSSAASGNSSIPR